MKQTLLSFLLALLPIVASADAVEIDGIYYNLVTKGKIAEVTRNPNHYSGDIVIPENITYNKTEYTVTIIKSGAFEGGNLTSISIPKTITKIESAILAFAETTNMNAVYITDLEAWLNITFEGEDDFMYPSNPLHYAHHLYLNGEEIKDLVIPNNISTIGDRVFLGASALTSVTFHNGITSIGQSAFKRCTSLTSVNIPNSVTSIGYYAFDGCI